MIIVHVVIKIKIEIIIIIMITLIIIIKVIIIITKLFAEGSSLSHSYNVSLESLNNKAFTESKT